MFKSLITVYDIDCLALDFVLRGKTNRFVLTKTKAQLTWLIPEFAVSCTESRGSCNLSSLRYKKNSTLAPNTVGSKCFKNVSIWC